MKQVIGYLGTTVMGVLTCAVTAIVVLLLQRWTGFAVWSFSVWFVVPIGALFTGAFAASGFALGARWLHCYPKKPFRILIVVCVAATWIGIYLAEYLTLSLDDGTRVSDLISFTTYLKLLFTKADHDFISRHGSAHGIQFGTLGYVVAATQFLGFLLGGFVLGDPPAAPDEALAGTETPK
jgi:hypothetical protein